MMLKRRTTTEKRKANTTLARHVDGFGVAFDDVWRWLPNRVSDWPKERPIEVAGDGGVCNAMHAAHGNWLNGVGKCWLCEATEVLQAHHVVSRYDVLTNIVMLCKPCHERIQHAQDTLPEVLLAKWQFDRLNTSWVFLTRLRGSWWPFDSLA